MSYRFTHLLLILTIALSAGVIRFGTLIPSDQTSLSDDLNQTDIQTLLSYDMRDTLICEGSCLDINNQTICDDETIVYQDDGIDVILNVVVVRPQIQTEIVELCFGDCFEDYCTDGNYTEIIKSQNDCDSLLMMYEVTVFPEIERTILPTIFLCPGECYDKPSFGGPVQVCNTESTPGGGWQDSPVLSSSTGCDSIIFLEIFFEKDRMEEIEALVCSGEVYSIGNELLEEEGTYPVTLTSVNGCDSTMIVNLSVGENSERDTTIQLCEGSFFLLDNVPQFSGNTTRSYVSESGCDSVVNFTFAVTDSIVIDTVVSKCLGDTLRIGSLAFHESSSQMFQIASDNAVCDSFIFVNVTFLDCSIEESLAVDSVRCSDDLTGRFSFTLTKGFGPFSYQWTYLDSIFMGSQVNLGEPISGEGLPQGQYDVTITDAVGNEKIIDVNINGPDYWSHEWEFTENNGYTISCNGGNDGEITVLPVGGVPPYSYDWSNGANTQTISELSAGTYAVTIKDVLNCSYIVQYEVTEPELLQIEIDSIKPNCDSFATGIITVVSEAGGVGPYEHFISGVGFSERDRFEGLLPGNYELIVSDANGCSEIFETYLPAPDIPDLEFDRQLYTNLADPIDFNILSNVPLSEIVWSTEEGLTCYNCLSPTANPTETTTYQLTAISNDGCEATESITVNIAKERDVFVPNIFSPNGDGLNDRLTIFGGPEVERIQMLQIFSRWGELVYERNNFLPNDPLIGWDGRFKGRKVPSNAYIWIAKVDFIDGVSLDYSGDVIVK